ncbi:hypothetical protein GQ457_12G009180 [Hibiscus cannabinus]
MAACLVSHDVAYAFIAVALACKQAVMFARDLDFSSVIIEGGSLTVMKKLNASNSDESIISPIRDPLYWIEEAHQHTTNVVDINMRRIFPLPGS